MHAPPLHATHNNDVNLGFEAFLWLFNTTLEEQRNSQNQSDKIYKQMIKEKDQLIKTEKTQKSIETLYNRSFKNK